MPDAEAQNVEDPVFPGSFVDQRAFDRARKRLETHLFAHREVLSPQPQPVKPLPKLAEFMSQADVANFAAAVRAFVENQSRDRRSHLRPGRRILAVGNKHWDFLPPPTVN